MTPRAIPLRRCDHAAPRTGGVLWLLAVRALRVVGAVVRHASRHVSARAAMPAPATMHGETVAALIVVAVRAMSLRVRIARAGLMRLLRLRLPASDERRQPVDAAAILGGAMGTLAALLRTAA